MKENLGFSISVLCISSATFLASCGPTVDSASAAEPATEAAASLPVQAEAIPTVASMPAAMQRLSSIFRPEPGSSWQWQLDTPVDITADARWLAEQAHIRGLSIGLKNDLDQAGMLANDFDWALTEECFVYDECDSLLPFLNAGKQAIDVEYIDESPALDTLCLNAKLLGIDLLFKEQDLTAFRKTCP